MSAPSPAALDVVRTAADAARLEREPLLVLEPLEAFLDEHGFVSGALAAEPIGDGHSNVTYLLRRGAQRLVLRRPPRGPLPPSAHDVLREARLLRALHPAGARVPEVLATCDDPAVIGAPFYLMQLVDGRVLGPDPAEAPASAAARAAIADELVDALAELHAIDLERAGLAGFGRPDGYLERQVRRFSQLLEANATRHLPDLEHVRDRLAETLPPSPAATVVHGDYRLGNVMLDREDPPRLVAILDWELAALGDPLADLGYLIATWAEPGDPDDPMLALSAVSRLPGFPRRRDLAERYAERTGHDVAALGWYEALALWKAAIFLEGSFKRHLAGSTDDPYFARLEAGVPALAARARDSARALG